MIKMFQVKRAPGVPPNTSIRFDLYYPSIEAFKGTPGDIWLLSLSIYLWILNIGYIISIYSETTKRYTLTINSDLEVSLKKLEGRKTKNKKKER